MKHEDFLNRIEGAYLKQEYLEAFLMQSAYIDGLVDVLLFVEVFFLFKSKDEPSSRREAMRNEIQRKLSRDTLYRKIELLKNGNAIKAETAKLLHEYREQRNKVLHQIIDETDREDFEDVLQKSYKIGKSLIEGELKKADKLVEEFKKAKDIK